ncbi:DNA mismatch endonuclease Vsr [Pseudomonas sp. ZY71]|jgi:DNA mismatch endonuclease (patch repair protein)|uniref:very short patch repair endonuclease n=1 Tax=Pseudomonas sp. ZY71 TaxID=3115647 RepID=UPI002F404A2E
MDIVSTATRSKFMANIKNKNTSPEIKVRKFIYSHGFRYRLHQAGIPGKPDIVIKRYRLCIFVNGCFWHRHPRCRLSSTPATRKEFWSKKFLDNITRDIKNRNTLLRNGWRVIDIWECGTRDKSLNLDWLIAVIPNMEIHYQSWP